MSSEASKRQRRNPKQARARASCQAILEAAAHILEREGPEGFNTNAIAERAGVSIGTLYQYFPDKAAILLAAAAREADGPDEGQVKPDRLRALLAALVAFVASLDQGGAARPALAAPSRPTPVRHRRGSVVIRLQWSAPAWWLRPLMTPAPLRAPPRRR